VHAGVIGLLPLDGAVRVELEQERARATRSGAGDADPVARDQVAALRGLDDREGVLGRGRGAARVEAVEAALPVDVAVRVELDDEHARVALRATGIALELAGGDVAAVC
jgi:hypothetical protein